MRMTTKARMKFALFLLALLVALPATAVGLSLLTQFVAAFQQGADPASIFRGHQLIIPDIAEARWISLYARGNAGGIPPKRSEREEIIAAYWEAWVALDRAYQTGDTSDLATYWAGSAYDQAYAGIQPGQAILQTHMGHKLRLVYFSADGSVAAFDDHAFTLTHTLHDRVITLSVSASVVMTLDQGFWRVRQMTLHYD